jgi:enoyl-CoA hydratase
VLQIMKGNDIYEGTRALIIEKDGQPEWQPTSLEYVSTSLVDRHFRSLGEMELCEV